MEATPSVIRTSGCDLPAMGFLSTAERAVVGKSTGNAAPRVVFPFVRKMADAEQQSQPVERKRVDGQDDKRAPDPSEEPFWAQCGRCFKWRQGVGGHMRGVALAGWRCEYALGSCDDVCDWCRRAECSCKGSNYEICRTDNYRLPVGFWAVIRFKNCNCVPVGTPWLVYRSVCSGCGSTSPGMDRRDKLEGWLSSHRGCRPEWKRLSLRDFDFRLSAQAREVYKQYLLAVKGGMKLSFGDLLLALQPCRNAWTQGKWREVREFTCESDDTKASVPQTKKLAKPSQLASHSKLGKACKHSKSQKVVVHNSAASVSQAANGRLQRAIRSGMKRPLRACDERQPKHCRLEELVLAAEQDMQQAFASTRPNLRNRSAVPQSMLESAQELLLLQRHPPVRLPYQAHMKAEYMGS
ncbi:unnamed protein product [Ostreobium quekettii]|uniref:Uncharacterized protein n=1 Tax=Ostreobium quekettii TaxID=121088 RepID=A0A8S1IZH1_9CHLO|nr:unnamed protein product [Ostreobium quekettii]|eukprot:evm.model.scf_4689.1 EVM.evm.TU.scf_4689.1   scf_4689:3345-4571(-)